MTDRDRSPKHPTTKMRSTQRKQPAPLIYRQSGMTLVEIMISLLIGAFLLGGVLQIFTNTKQTYRMQEGLSRMQENARFALDTLNHDLRMAGYQGCTAVTPNVIIDPKSPNPNPAPASLALGTMITIGGNDNIANNWNSSACGNANACIAGSDAITITFGGTCGGALPEKASTAQIHINAGNTCDFKQYDIVMVSDCSAADIFIATSASSSAGKQNLAHANNQNTDNKLSKIYDEGAEVFRFNSYTYFLRTGAGGQPALWRLDNSRAVQAGINPIEMIDAIENMQILYGEDTTQDRVANRYVTANNVGNWANVVSARASLLARSLNDNITSRPQTYTFNGATITPADRRLRQVFTTTIAVRNRLP
ncbi:MAG TPA: pilus assembly protein PilW [Methylococcaceae bacterium]|nr:pilus assembly protein PilW [Methylococcaceae bacterium]